MKGMKILIPIITNSENDPTFLEKVIKGVDEVHLLRVVDSGSKSELPAAAMMQGNSVVQDITNYLKPKVKEIEEVVEWGDPLNKISHYAKLKEIKKIILKREDSQFMKDLAKNLRAEELDVEVK